jgi:hypothetical protein
MSAQDAPEGADRRRARRYAAHRLPTLRASLLAGPDVAVLNVSRGGLLLESEVRLRPGAGICLNVRLDDETHRLDGHVSHVDATIVEGRVVYRAGVSFDREMPLFDLGAPDGRDRSAPSGVPPPPIPVTTIDPARDASAAETSRLREELESEREKREQQAATIAALRDALESGERLRRGLLEEHASERERWAQEQQELLERVREAEDQASAMMQDMRIARDAARKASRAHASELAACDAHVRERDQQIAALRAEHAALLESVSAQLETLERRDATRSAQEGRLAEQLASSEAWCADQQDLLYRVRQQMNAVFALLQGEDGQSLPALPAAPESITTRAPRALAIVRALPARRHEG